MPDYHKLNDDELTDLVRESDEQAFAEIYQRYWTIMYMHALKMLKNEEDARDVIQELFTSFWSKCQSMTSSINLSGYLYTILRNKVIDLIQQKKTRSGHLESLARYIEDHHDRILENLTEKEMMQALDREIEQLPGKMKVIFQMRVKEHKTYQEISEKLKISDKTVKKQVSNAIKIVKPKLKGFAGWPMLLYFLSK